VKGIHWALGGTVIGSLHTITIVVGSDTILGSSVSVIVRRDTTVWVSGSHTLLKVPDVSLVLADPALAGTPVAPPVVC